MSTKDRFKMFGTCDICHKEVLAQNCFRLVYDLLYCPECYENIIHEGRLDGRDSGDSVDSGLDSDSGDSRSDQTMSL